MANHGVYRDPAIRVNGVALRVNAPSSIVVRRGWQRGQTVHLAVAHRDVHAL